MMVLCLAQKLRHRGNVKIADSSPRQPGCDLLQEPAVAIRIVEGGERVVTGMRRVRTAGPKSSKYVGLVRAGVHVAAVEDFADFDAATEQIFPGGLNVGDGQVQALGRAGRSRGHVLAEDYRAPRAGRRELDPAPVVASGEI